MPLVIWLNRIPEFVKTESERNWKHIDTIANFQFVLLKTWDFFFFLEWVLNLSAFSWDWVNLSFRFWSRSVFVPRLGKDNKTIAPGRLWKFLNPRKLVCLKRLYFLFRPDNRAKQVEIRLRFLEPLSPNKTDLDGVVGEVEGEDQAPALVHLFLLMGWTKIKKN